MVRLGPDLACIALSTARAAPAAGSFLFRFNMAGNGTAAANGGRYGCTTYGAK
jgi:hypothetical protein